VPCVNNARVSDVWNRSGLKSSAVVLFALTIACSNHETPAAKRAASPDSARTASAEVARAAETDEWTRAEVEKRLGEAGLVVVDSNRVVHHPGISAPGFLLEVSGSPLELYLFPTAADRKRLTASMDTMPPAAPNAQRPRYIVSGNLVAIHVSPRDVLAERVENVLTARHAGAP
jgi:hypothetical protein